MKVYSKCMHVRAKSSEITRFVLGGLVAVILSGCETMSPLSEHLEAYNYEEFTPMRSRDGVATIIDYKDGYESIVASPEPPESVCMVPSKVPVVIDDNIGIANREYTITSGYYLELGIAKDLLKGLDLSAAYNDKRIQHVRITILDPFEKRISRDSVKRYLNTLSNDDLCLEYIQDEDNLIINKVLGAGKIIYELIDENNLAIKIDAELLGYMKAKPSVQNDLNGKDSVVVEGPILIGYRAWNAVGAAGLTGRAISLREVNRDQLADRKRSSK